MTRMQLGETVMKWEELFDGAWQVTGNAAKVQALHVLRQLGSTGKIRVIDIGVVGPDPLDFWTPLMAAGGFDVTGVDVAGVDRAKQVAQERGWTDSVRLVQGSGYELDRLFEPESFDIAVATQVLEHVAKIDHFMHQVNRVLRPGGHALFTFDSAHWLPRFSIAEPRRFLKNAVKKSLALLGRERHYDLPWTAEEAVEAAYGAGLEPVEVRYHNLHPLKYLHNHVVPPSHKNDFMREWFALEALLNATGAATASRKSFLGVYLHARKR